MQSFMQVYGVFTSDDLVCNLFLLLPLSAFFDFVFTIVDQVFDLKSQINDSKKDSVELVRNTCDGNDWNQYRYLWFDDSIVECVSEWEVIFGSAFAPLSQNGSEVFDQVIIATTTNQSSLFRWWFCWFIFALFVIFFIIFVMITQFFLDHWFEILLTNYSSFRSNQIRQWWSTQCRYL